MLKIHFREVKNFEKESCPVNCVNSIMCISFKNLPSLSITKSLFVGMVATLDIKNIYAIPNPTIN